MEVNEGTSFCERNVAGARDNEKSFNPNIAEVKVIVNGIPNKVYSQGMKTRGNVATSADRREVLSWVKSDEVCREVGSRGAA